MRILIVGVGALGGYFGARLVNAGRDVTFLVRPRSAQLLAQHGLRVLSPTHGDVFLEHPRTVQAPELREHYDIILLSAKAYDLDGAMESFAPAVGPDTVILPMLNGMAHMAKLDRRFSRENVLGGTCFISAVRDADGTIRHLNDRDQLFFGDRDDPASERMKRVAAVLGALHNDVGFIAKLRSDILQDMWEKWSFLATLAGSTCMMRASIGDIVAVAPTLTLRLYDECCAIAGGQDHQPSPAFRELHRTILTRPGSNFTASMLRDLEESAPVESYQILGDLLTYGRHHGLNSPLLELAYAHVCCYEERRAHEQKA
jgi:2-dehydropantoate 2-reductase